MITEAAKLPPLKDMRPFPLLNYIGWAYGQLIPKIAFNEGFKAVPANISLGVNEKVNILVGNYDLETGEFAPVPNWFFFADRFLTFQADVLSGNPGGVWFINFNPPTVSLKQNPLLVTNATISMTSPPMADEPIQNTIIRITIYDTWAMNNIWWPELRDPTGQGREFWPKPIGNNTFFNYDAPLMWLFGAVTGGFGRLSGTTFTDVYYVDVIVTVKPFHMVKIEALQPSKLTPNEITSIPILVENQGNYNDTFGFRLRSESGYPLTLTHNETVTLRPGEQGQALIGIAVPANILDTGTLHSIYIDAYSAEQPNSSIASQRIFIETQGLYFSEQNSMYTIGFGLLLLFVIIFLVRQRRKDSEKNGRKPEKPWKIPEEQQHLAELKRTDRNAYEQERIMMEDEYKSTLRWYKESRKSLGKKSKEKKPKKKPKEKPKKKLPVLLEKPVTKPKEEIVKPIILAEDINKEKAIERIKKEQEKQLRRMK